MSHASPDAAVVMVSGTRVPLQPQAARSLLAQLHLRRSQDAGPDDALIPHTPKALAKALTDAATDLGIHVFGRRAERTRDHTTGALRALGITLERLP